MACWGNCGLYIALWGEVKGTHTHTHTHILTGTLAYSYHMRGTELTHAVSQYVYVTTPSGGILNHHTLK